MDISSIQPKDRLAYKRAWYQKHKERLRAKIREANHRFYYKDIEASRARGRARTKMLWASRPDDMRRQSREATRKWRAANPERRKAHVRKNDLKQFGLSPEAYEGLLAQQGGVCAICRKKDKKRRLAVDHCHVTNRVRGLLCAACNLALGKFSDDCDTVARALSYLAGHAPPPKKA